MAATGTRRTWNSPSSAQTPDESTKKGQKYFCTNLIEEDLRRKSTIFKPANLNDYQNDVHIAVAAERLLASTAACEVGLLLRVNNDPVPRGERHAAEALQHFMIVVIGSLAAEPPQIEIHEATPITFSNL